MAKVYVGNLRYSTTDESVKELFGQFGEVVSAVVIKDRATGQSKGFGFVEMADDDAARAAMQALNGKDFEGRRLRVNEAEDRPRPPRRDQDGFGRRDGGYRDYNRGDYNRGGYSRDY